MSDLIDRQEAIDAWKEDFKGFVNSLNMPRDDYKGIMEYIDEVPSAQPERKPGKWIIDHLCSTSGGTYQVLQCSVCEHQEPWLMGRNYCPNCGARMKEGE